MANRISERVNRFPALIGSSYADALRNRRELNLNNLKMESDLPHLSSGLEDIYSANSQAIHEIEAADKFHYPDQAVAVHQKLMEKVALSQQLINRALRNNEERRHARDRIVATSLTFSLVGLVTSVLIGLKRADKTERNAERANRVIAELQQRVQRLSITQSQSDELTSRMSEELHLAQAESERAHHASRKFKMRADTLMTGLPIACFAFDNNGIINEWNQQAELVFGVPAESAIGTTPCTAIRTNDLHAIKGSVARVLAGGTIQRAQRQIFDKENATRTITYSAFPTYDGESNIVGGVFASIDITEQEQSRVHSETVTTKLDETLANIDQAFISLNADLRFENVNPAAEYKFALESVVGSEVTLWEAIPDTPDGLFRQHLNACTRNNFPSRFEYCRPDTGEWFDVRLFPSASGVNIFLDDISERVRDREALTRNEKMFRTALREMHDAVIITNAKGIVQTCNQKANEILGIKEQAAIGQRAGKNLANILDVSGSPVPVTRRPIERACRGETVIGERFQLIRKGEMRWVTVNASPIYAPDGTVELALASFRDDTELIESRAELQHRLQILEDLVRKPETEDGATTPSETFPTDDLANRTKFESPEALTLMLQTLKICPGHVVVVNLDRRSIVDSVQNSAHTDETQQNLAACLWSALKNSEQLFQVGDDAFAIPTENPESLKSRLKLAIDRYFTPSFRAVASLRVIALKVSRDARMAQSNQTSQARNAV